MLRSPYADCIWPGSCFSVLSGPVLRFAPGDTKACECERLILTTLLFHTCRLAYKLLGDADYVQHGILSAAEQQRLDGMEPGPVAAEVAATSTTHRKAAAKRARPGGGYWGVCRDGRQWKMQISRNKVTIRHWCATEKKAAQAYDDEAWKHDGWCAHVSDTSCCCLLCGHMWDGSTCMQYLAWYGGKRGDRSSHTYPIVLSVSAGCTLKALQLPSQLQTFHVDLILLLKHGHVLL